MSRHPVRIARFCAIIALIFYLLYRLLKITFGDQYTEYVNTAIANHGSSLIGATNSNVNLATELGVVSDDSSQVPLKHQDNLRYNRESAVFVTLARNSDLESLVQTVRSYEDRFNDKFHYDWVFLNDQEFNDEFKRVMSKFVSGKALFGVIPHDHWSFPEWIDLDKAADTREQMKDIIYGDSVSYRHMCRYESGFFWRHPLLDEYKYYWRVEPDTELFCDVDYDVFKVMRENKYKYGFTISMYEYLSTIPSLWETTQEFVKSHPEFVSRDPLIDFISNDGGESFNLCHFWSNFEIADLDFWRSDAYRAYFDHLDHAGGFFYERWGDAPVHTLAAVYFLDKSEIHFFDDIGYMHPPYIICPTQAKDRLDLKCTCKAQDNFAWKGYSCTSQYYDAMEMSRPEEWTYQTDR